MIAFCSVSSATGMLTATDEAAALDILKANRARLVMVDWELPFRDTGNGSLAGRFENLADWAGIPTSHFYSLCYSRAGDTDPWTPSWIYYEPYYQTMAYRLMVLGGTAPLVITTDGQRAGAVEQLAAFTRVLGITVAVAPTPAMLAKALTHRGHGQPVLIDTAGCNPFNAAEARQLHQIFTQAGADMVLVLPAGLDAAESADLARAFAALGARHLLPTRLDAARRLGGVLMAAKAGPLALTEAGIGAEVADGLEALTPEGLASRLLAAPPQGADTPGKEFS